MEIEVLPRSKKLTDINYADRVKREVLDITNKYADCLWLNRIDICITRGNHIEAFFKESNGTKKLIRTLNHRSFIEKYLKPILKNGNTEIKAKDKKDYVI